MSRDYCQNYGERPGCLGSVDERFTMDFTDVEPGAYIRWCSVCGPEAHAMEQAITKALCERPGFAEVFASAIVDAERKQRESAT